MTTKEAIKILHDAGVRTAQDFERLMVEYQRLVASGEIKPREALSNTDSPKLAGDADAKR